MIRLGLRNLNKRFGGVAATNDVSFDVPAAGVTAVIGPNGAGKTTLFNLISGFLPPDSGAIVFEGAPIAALKPHRRARLGLVRTFQLVQLFSDMSALDNVKVGRHTRTQAGVLGALLPSPAARAGGREIDRACRELLDFVGIAHLSDRPAKVLPYGQQRLLEVARALAAEPKLLMLDEPAAGLDAGDSQRLAATIRKVAERGVTVLLIEHDMNLVMSVADHVVVLDFGSKIAEGPPAAVRSDPAVLAAYLGGAEIAHG